MYSFHLPNIHWTSTTIIFDEEEAPGIGVEAYIFAVNFVCLSLQCSCTWDSPGNILILVLYTDNTVTKFNTLQNSDK